MHGYVLSHRNDKRGSDTNVFANREVGGGFMLRCMLHEMRGEGVMNEITQKRSFFCMHPLFSGNLGALSVSNQTGFNL